MRALHICFIACASLLSSPLAAQQDDYLTQIGVSPSGDPMCSGPFGPGLCEEVAQWLITAHKMDLGPMGLPTRVIPNDGQILAQVTQACGGNPQCVAFAWADVEIQRCANGVGVPGGCFGPNGEIMKVINRVVPQHLQPNVILHNIDHDIRHGLGPNNEIRKFFGF